MQQIKDTVLLVLKDLQQGGGEKSCPDEWVKKVFAKKDLKHLKVKYFRKGILGFVVDSSAWMYYFKMRKDLALQKLSAINPQVKDLRFHIGEIDAV